MSFDFAQDYKQKGLAPILIVILVVVLGIGGYFMYTSLREVLSPSKEDMAISPTSTPQPSSSTTGSIDSAETTNWKIYTNTKVGFQIKYPTNITQINIPSGMEPAYAKGDEDQTEIIFNDIQSGMSYSLTVFPFTGSLDEIVIERKTVKSAFSTNKIPIIFPDTPLNQIRTLVVDGKTANWYQTGYTNGSTDGPNEIHFLGAGHGFIFRDVQGNGRFSEKDINQILSTFRFLDTGASKLRICPDSWFEFLSPIQVLNNPYYGQKGQFMTINSSPDLIPTEKFDLEWIKQNCQLKEPEPVG